MTEKYYITITGLNDAKKELEHLKNIERPLVISAISKSRNLGDLSENAEYHAAKQHQGYVEGRIKYLTTICQQAIAIDCTKLSNDVVQFGSIVLVNNLSNNKEIKFQIVGEYEVDVAKNLISIFSPIGKILLNKKINDIIEVATPNGYIEYEIIKINISNVP